MKRTAFLPLILALALVLSACGASVKTESARPAEEVYLESPAAMAEPAAGVSNSISTDSGKAAAPEGRKWIVTIHMNAETEDLDQLLTSLQTQVADLGGYLEDQEIYNGSSYSSYRHRSAHLTVRIPDEKVSQFTDSVEGMANVVSQNLSREDITLQYVSTASRITALETEQARLLELLDQAQTVEELLQIEDRLTDVRYELENHASRLRLYDNQVDYATIYLSIEEVQKYTPVEEPTVWERITGGFRDSVEGVTEGVVDLFVLLIAGSPYLVIYGLGGLLIYQLIKRLRRRKPIKKAPRNDGDPQ